MNFIVCLLALIACVANFGFCQNIHDAASNIIGHATGAIGDADVAASANLRLSHGHDDSDDSDVDFEHDHDHNDADNRHIYQGTILNGFGEVIHDGVLEGGADNKGHFGTDVIVG
ncbi:uncharacterized protein CELE_Y51A2A.4 [Caenorhabditis elegans]|uniref:Secreted protein n=1 Tax=Caenorhabditis elegans TaxID=6239 RepID=Q9U269_CAEEL|nr:Secreted protein [Caenorhabditis elegans]CAB63378.2 Secreted protein [Caenorhabditis elegans]|eukprot:NP_001256795.1 Uncharacterized protein CELE_Y51A2A.4 [Caenorhabditis elegans]